MSRKTLPVQLRRSHRQLWRLAETNIIGIYSSDLSGRIYEANDYVLNLLGYTREEMLRGELTWTGITPLEYLPLDYTQIDLVSRRGSSDTYEKEYIRKDGSRVPVLIGFSEIVRASGQYICFILDQAERWRSVEQLRESEEKFRATFEQAAVGVAHVSPAGTWLRTNRKLCEILGYGESEPLPPSMQDIISSEDLGRMLDCTRDLYEGKTTPFSLEVRGVRRDRSLVWLEITISLIRDASGNAKYHVLVIQEIGERKSLQESLKLALEAAEEGNRAKSEFLANMSHELRTPLTGVLGMIQLVMENAISREDREMLDIALGSGNSMLRLIQDLLDFSRIEAGRMSFETCDFDVMKCVASAVSVVKPEAAKKEIPIWIAMAGDVPATACGDEGRLRQVLVNLLGNAVKFTERGEIKIAVSMEDHDYLLFSVSDTGIGIPAGKLHLLFKVFSQADSSTTKRYGGTGLGLALSRQIVERMGGQIWVETKEGSGSVFFFTIPVKSPCGTPGGGEETTGVVPQARGATLS